ncbi:NfeD family protein [Corynebacterium sp. UMB9976]|uniref:NfeD family protein n=1 Tax=unclassified Corynebacterium TaxID=2624378 RepID=UPI00254C3768|nr:MULTISPECIES: NfeD family protein [unclassified Corynebacterium]MDK6301982.1 NfeD family protein [Corynebacterium sp. UMB9976]MDK8790790.1 NfeD family protein [Corynebacterium sp. MSK039]
MGALIWFIAALVLAGLELAAGEFTLLMLAGGATVGGLVEWAGAPTWAAIVAFGIATAGLILFLRPILRRRLHGPKALDTSQQALVGATAEVLEDVGARGGQIRLDGSIWSARSMDPSETFTKGEEVHVIDIDGPTAVVWKHD